MEREGAPSPPARMSKPWRNLNSLASASERKNFRCLAGSWPGSAHTPSTCQGRAPLRCGMKRMRSLRSRLRLVGKGLIAGAELVSGTIHGTYWALSQGPIAARWPYFQDFSSEKGWWAYSDLNREPRDYESLSRLEGGSGFPCENSDLRGTKNNKVKQSATIVRGTYAAPICTRPTHHPAPHDPQPGATSRTPPFRLARSFLESDGRAEAYPGGGIRHRSGLAEMKG